MDTGEVLQFELTWLHLVGAFSSPGHVHAVARLAGFVMPAPLPSGAVASLLFREDGAEQHMAIRETDVSLDVLREVAQLARDGGWHLRAPDVQMVVDTADTWNRLQVRVALNDSAHNFAIHTQCSGFKGPDAEAFRALLRRVLALTVPDSELLEHPLYRSLAR